MTVEIRCPLCGCQRTTPLVRDAWGRPTQARSCNHCGHTFGMHQVLRDESKQVGYDSAKCRCPKCNTANPKVTRTMPPRIDGVVIRYHRCHRCGHKFSSKQDDLSTE